jgi:ADP-heptose:LPS heptosyltransferase
VSRPQARALDSYKRVLVIKLGALGDFVQALAAMAQIRRAHPGARITLLTTPTYADLAKASGYFDDIDVHGRPSGLLATLRLFRWLRRGRYERVYDLQTSSRSRNYYYAFAPAFPEWSGITPGASHRHANPRRDRMQNLDRLWDQLAEAGAAPPLAEGLAAAPDLAWAVAAAERETPSLSQRFGLKPPYALLAPGASPGRPRKRWPAAQFIQLAKTLEGMGLTPVVIGGGQEIALGEAIARAAPTTLVLTGRTKLVELAALGAGAAVMVGNDTGPTYLAAFAGAPTVVLFSADSDPALCAPRSQRLAILQRDDLADLSVDDVTNAIRLLLGAA